MNTEKNTNPADSPPSGEKAVTTPLWRKPWFRWSAAAVAIVVLGLAIGLGAGLGVKHARENSANEDENAEPAVSGLPRTSSTSPAKTATQTTATTATTTSQTFDPSATPVGSVRRSFSADAADSAAGSSGVWALNPRGGLFYRSDNVSDWNAFKGYQFLTAPVVVQNGADTRTGFTIEQQTGSLVELQYRDGAWIMDNFNDLGSQFIMRPAAISRAEGLMDVFAVHTNGSLMHIASDGSQWKAWEVLGNDFVGEVSATSWGQDRIDLFARSGRTFKHASWSPEGWSEWEDLGTPVPPRMSYETEDRDFAWPLAVSWAEGKIDLIVLDGSTWHKVYDGGSWSAKWNIVSASHEGLEFANTATLVPTGRDPVAAMVARGTDDCMHLNQFNGTDWTFWQYIWCLPDKEYDRDNMYPTHNISTSAILVREGLLEVLGQDLLGDTLRLLVELPIDHGSSNHYNDAWERLGSPGSSS